MIDAPSRWETVVRHKPIFAKVRAAAVATGAVLMMLGLPSGQASAAARNKAGTQVAAPTTLVSASRLALLSRGINADNIVNNSRVATYDSVDLAQLTTMGFTYVRIPIDPSWIMAGVPVDYQAVPSSSNRAATGLARLDQNIAMFVQAGFAVTLVIQPQSKVIALPDDQSQDIINRADAILASRYASQYTPDQLFFEELNEPHYTSAVWNAFQPTLLATLRNSAPNHTIIVPPYWHDNPENLASLTLANDLNVVYTMHVYQPGKLTQQGSGATILPNYMFPRVSDVTEWTYTKMDTYIYAGVKWALANKVPLIMNEFGATNVSNRTARVNWVSFVRAEADKYHFGWAWWAFDGRLFGMRPLGGDFDPDLVQLLAK